tara:strand:+ start:506 stop:1117 length:612 start_codon:yes stop_codon:yes gene_type:complete
MEHKKAHDFLYNVCKVEGFIELANHIKHVGPLKLQVSNKNFVTHLSKIIVGQQVSVAAARAIWDRTKKILRANKYKKPNKNLDQQMRKAGLSRQKIEYLNGIIFNKNINTFTKSKLKKMNAEDYFNLLIDIKGIGPWSIEMSRIFYIGDPDVFSILDLGLKNAHLKIFDIESYTESFYKRFSPYRSYMCLYLWRVLEDENVTI